MQENNNLHRVEKKEISTGQIELKSKLNPIDERYKEAVSKTMKYFDSFQFGNHDSYKKAMSKSEDWLEPKSLTTE